MLARRHGLALVVHSRDAWDDTFDVLSGEDVPERMMLHCFTGGTDLARRFLDLGAYLSFSGIVTFKNATDVRDTLTTLSARAVDGGDRRSVSRAHSTSW